MILTRSYYACKSKAGTCVLGSTYKNMHVKNISNKVIEEDFDTSFCVVEMTLARTIATVQFI